MDVVRGEIVGHSTPAGLVTCMLRPKITGQEEALLQDPWPRMPSRSDIVLITRTVTVAPDTQLMPAVHPTKI